MSGVENCTKRSDIKNYPPKTVEETDAIKTKMPVVFTDNKEDALNCCRSTEPDFMDKLKYDCPFPDWAAEKVPEEILLLSSSRCYLVDESVDETMKNLPKKPDGSVDIEKVQQALKIAVEFIKESNKKALETINHGIYAQQVNNVNVIGQVFGPEIVAVLEYIGFDVDKFNSDFSVHQADFMGHIIADMRVESSPEIEKQIKLQNAQLDKLLKLDLNQPENLEKFLKGYKNATGTSFSVDRIMTSKDNNLSKDVKLQNSVASFGMRENLINAYKNKIASDAWVQAVKGTVSAILTNSSNPIAKIIGNLLPYHMELVELLTQGRKEGELINTDNITFKNMTNAYLDATKTVAVNNIPFVGKWYYKILQKLGVNLSNVGLKAGVNAVID